MSRSQTPPLPLRHPAVLFAVLACAASIGIAVSFRIGDTDFWQHLVVGRAIWRLHSVPTTQLWSWPTYGAPDVNSSWGFRALVWPFWGTAGLAGLFVWRWLTTLAVFGLLWAAARRMGARGLAPLAVLALCALTYRERSQIRPETLVAVLFALQIWILETRRHGGPDRAWWLVPLAWTWVNVHISYPLGFAMLGIHAVAGGGARLWMVGVAAVAISFVNPFGWRALAQPFEFFLSQRGDPLFQSIGELMPLDWRGHLRSGLPLLMLGWPALLAWRARRRGLDLVELLACAGLTALALSIVRFLGFYAVVAAPYVARDLGEWIAARAWPSWAGRPWARATLVSVACGLAAAVAWTDPSRPPEIGMESKRYPIEACDFMRAHRVRGRAFNQFHLGGYMLHRFWPDRQRLPFMDIHQSGGPRERRLYTAAFVDSGGWHQLRDVYRIDYALLWRVQVIEDRLLDYLDADTSFALVFLDDAAALFVRRRGALAPVADSFAYRVLPAGRARLGSLGRACEGDAELRQRVRAELERQAKASRFKATAHSFLASIALMESRWGDARRHLRQVRKVDPTTPRISERLGIAALEEGRLDEAIVELRRQQIEEPRVPRHAFQLARAYHHAGDPIVARKWYRRAVALDPGFGAARDSVAVLDRALSRTR